MTGRERLDRYLGALQRRLRAQIYGRAFAACALTVLAATCATVWLLEREQYAPFIALAGRVVIAFALVSIVAFLAVRPLLRLHRDRGAQVIEARLPEQRGRIQTYLDRKAAGASSSPLLDLLAEDAAQIAERTPVQWIVSSRGLGMAFAAGVAAAAGLALLLAIGPAHWGFGSRHVLFGAELPRSAVPLRKVLVEPGDATVRRNSDLSIRASVSGFRPEGAQLLVRFAGQEAWERASMQPVAEDGSRFEFRLYAVRAPLSYYVEADGTKSAEHSVGVADLPKIERVRLTYSYPEWTGLEPAVDEEVRDIRAVAGTNVRIEVFADAPLEAPALIIDGVSRELSAEDRASVGVIDVQKPGAYQIGARVANEFVALSDEYAIELVPDEKPAIEIVKPARDWRATSIEEVPVKVEAQDDFRLREVQLRYSVNGGEWKSVSMGGGSKTANSESLLRLEELGAEGAGEQTQLVPGDLVSYYAVAKDRRHAAQTDLFMVQVQPFERRFTQAQAGGAGAGMGDDQGAISERQREILLATWNLQRNDQRNTRTRAQLEDNARMLSELQAKLAQQARTLSARTRARASLEDERIKTFVESLDRAAAAMDPAARRLHAFRLEQAVPLEQQALQQLLRAEAAFREVQVSMQQSSPGAAGAQNSRNFTEMFELEMDLEKNQYESESQVSMQSRQQEIEEAIRKLKELAERQERLAEQAKQQDLRAEEQRWRQEQLRREAEDLRRRLAEMNRREQSSSQSSRTARGEASGQASGQRSSSQANGEPGEEQSSESQREQERSQLAQALESVNRALEEMRAANERAGQDSKQANEAARKASENLRRALKGMDQPKPSNLDEALEQLAQRAGELGDDQRRIESDLYRALAQSGQAGQFNYRGSLDRRQAQELVEAKQRLASDLGELEKDMRGAVHEHRKRQPESARRVSESLRDLEASDAMHLVNRSAAEIYYGRAREAATREGLISEALENLERDLKEATALAAREGKGEEEHASPDALLAEVAEMRRALQQGRNSRRQSDAEGSQGAQSERPGPSADASQGGVLSSDYDAPRGSARALPREVWDAKGSLAREMADIGQRVRDAANRMSRGELTQAEFEALRRRANELRRLSGDPLAEERELMSLIDQIELAALAAAPQSKDDAAARATAPSPASQRYREAVAEYYRRLGSR